MPRNMQKAYTVRVRETVIHEYDVEAESEAQARAEVHAKATSPPMILATLDWEIEKVEAAQ